MNTEVVARPGSLRDKAVVHTEDTLGTVVEHVLAAVRPAVLTDPVSGALRAEESLRDALRHTYPAADGATEQAMACAEAACEHLKYCELPEARILLVAARGQLARAQKS